MCHNFLPTGFDDAGQLAFLGFFPETQTAKTETPHIPAGSAAKLAAVTLPYFEFLLFLEFDYI